MRTNEPSGRNEYRQADYVLRTLSQQSGGRVAFVTAASELPGVYTQIADELASQYTLAYRSTNLKRDGTWRRVAVRVPTHEAVARTRSGYFATKAPR